MSERRKRVTRRAILGSAAAAAPLAQSLPGAQETGGHGAHSGPAAVGAGRFLSDYEFATLRALCERIIPADDVSPGATEAGAAEYIDLLCCGNARLARIYHGGLAWLDSVSLDEYGVGFVEAGEPRQTAIVERLAYKAKVPRGWQAGAQFFDWARRMTIDAFYTSQVGYRDLEYKGGHGMTEYQVPAEALKQALGRWKA